MDTHRVKELSKKNGNAFSLPSGSFLAIAKHTDMAEIQTVGARGADNAELLWRAAHPSSIIHE